MLSDELQLGLALEAFQFAHKLPPGFATTHLLYFKTIGISSMADLAGNVDYVNIDMELFGIPPEEQLSESTIRYLKSFLPGPVGFRCFRLAQKAAQMVKKGHADTEYVHRPESGKKGDEQWSMPYDGDWVLHVDCAGFVRHTLKHVTKDSWQMALSDRDFMRAKDFYAFFQTIPYTVMDKEEFTETDKRMKWRIVPDLRMVIPGDVIVYRPRGNAAGGAAFTTNDRSDLTHLLRAVKTAQLWHLAGVQEGTVTRNVAKDPQVKPWVTQVKAKLRSIGIRSVKDVRLNIDTLNEQLKAHNFSPLLRDTIQLMKECSETTAQNTGHIVFAAGPAVPKEENQYRIRVVHSTKYGQNSTQGIEEHYRRFQLVERSDGTSYWTRTMRQANLPSVTPVEDLALTDDDDNPNDDMEDDPQIRIEDTEDDAVDPNAEANDELAGQAEVDVLAVRMSF